MARRARAHAVPVPGYGVEPCSRAVNEHTRDRRARAAQRPDRRARSAARAAAHARGAARARRRAARRGARRLRRRAAARRRARAARGLPAPALLPLVLEGLGPGGAARRLRARRPGVASRCSSSSRPSWASTSSHRRARWRRCASTEHLVRRRVERVRGERARLLLELRSRDTVTVTPSEANFVWLEAAASDGAELDAPPGPRERARRERRRPGRPEAHPRLDPRRHSRRPLPARPRRRTQSSLRAWAWTRQGPPSARGAAGASCTSASRSTTSASWR